MTSHLRCQVTRNNDDMSNRVKQGKYKLDPLYRGLYVIIGRTHSTVYLRPLKNIEVTDINYQNKIFQELFKKGKSLPVLSVDITRIKKYQPLIIDNLEYLKYSKTFMLPRPLYIGKKGDVPYISDSMQFFQQNQQNYLFQENEIEFADKVMNINPICQVRQKSILRSERSNSIRNLSNLARKMYGKIVQDKGCVLMKR